MSIQLKMVSRCGKCSCYGFFEDDMFPFIVMLLIIILSVSAL